jgi:hypothetical protein
MITRGRPADRDLDGFLHMNRAFDLDGELSMLNLSPVTQFLCPCGAENHSFTDWPNEQWTDLPVLCWQCDEQLAVLPGVRIWTSSSSSSAQELRENTPPALLHLICDVIQPLDPLSPEMCIPSTDQEGLIGF